MRNTFRVLFYIKKNAPLRNGEVPIMGRITICGQRAQFSTQISTPLDLWDVSSGRATGRSAAASAINERISKIRYRIEVCYETIFGRQELITPQMVKDMYFGISHGRQTLLDFFRQHNNEFLQMVGVTRSLSTYNKYRCVYGHLGKYIQGRYGKPDLGFRELDRDFITGFHAYIARENVHRKNTIWIYMIAFKHILMLARSKGFLGKDLFLNYTLHSEFVARNYLSDNELLKVMQVHIDDPTLQLVRDAFLFGCFTGLSYVDMRNLAPKHLHQDHNKLWINTKRLKTGTEVHVRLFAVARDIILKYSEKSSSEPIFNLPGNGWCNICLEKIRRIAGIDKRITFHCARHTFATTITLSQGMALETIGKLLGHRNIHTTQIYAAVTHMHLDAEMERLSRKLDLQYGKPAVRLPQAVSPASGSHFPFGCGCITSEKA